MHELAADRLAAASAVNQRPPDRRGSRVAVSVSTLVLLDLPRPTRARRRPTATAPQRVRAWVRTLLDALPTPAFVLGRRLDVLTTNRMTRALL